MPALDPRTILLISGLLYITMPLVIFLALREQKNTMITHWVVGGEIFGLGIMLVGGRGQMPDWASYDLAHLCLFAGNLTRIHALRLEIHRASKPKTMMGLLAALFGIYLVARASDPQQLLSYYVSLFTLALTFGWISLLSRQLAGHSHLSSAHWMGHIYLLLTVIVCIRLLQVMSGHSLPGIMSQDVFSLAIPMAGMFAAVLGNTTYMGVYLERATRQQLRQAKEAARRSESMRLSNQIAQLDRQRSMGLIAMSLAHEISQPLSNIHMIAERAELSALKSQPADPARVKSIADILRNIQNATDIIERLRNYIKAKNSPRQNVNLTDLHHNVLSLLGDWLRTELVETHTDAPSTPVMAHVDPVQISQILVNLYRNGAQASAGQDQHQLHIRIAQEQNRAVLQVRDNGPGFSAAMLNNSAEPFLSAKTDGLGVGLTISRHIAQQHQGTLTLGNASEGGAVVTLSLPLAASDAT